ncbi:hypothetical protein V2G26_019115 [Clonostachys chloroleuca]
MPYTSPHPKSNILPSDDKQEVYSVSTTCEQSQRPNSTSRNSGDTRASDRSPIGVAKHSSPRYAADDSAWPCQYGGNIDYLDYSWEEEHLWWSWKYITSHRRYTAVESRLENAIWRAWAKRKHNLRTVPPNTINWLRDIGYLYGPFRLHTDDGSGGQARPHALLPYSRPLIGSILKERRKSDVFIQATQSSAYLSHEATGAAKAPVRKGVHFDDKVEQRVSVDGNDTASGESFFLKLTRSLQLAAAGRRVLGNHRRTSSSPEATMAMLPTKTLKS